MTDAADPARPQPVTSDDVAEADHPTGYEGAARNRDEESPA
jgi:hypothetical protein